MTLTWFRHVVLALLLAHLAVLLLLLLRPPLDGSFAAVEEYELAARQLAADGIEVQFPLPRDGYIWYEVTPLERVAVQQRRLEEAQRDRERQRSRR